MKWTDSSLYQALTSLELHRRVVSLGLDGSLAANEDTVDADRNSGSGGTSTEPLPLESHYFVRAVIWRIYLNLLPLPFAGTSMENIVGPWAPKLFLLRATYAAYKQSFHECYPQYAEPDKRTEASISAVSGGSGAGLGGPLDELGMSATDRANNGSAFFTGSESEETAAATVGTTTTATTTANFLQQQPPRRGSVSAKKSSSSSFSFFRQSVSNASNVRSSSIGKPSGILEQCSREVAEDIIALDIRRTYLSHDPEIPHAMLFNLLCVWRWKHPTVGYHQGMHELAGAMLQVLARAALHVPDECPPEVQECANPGFREADAYYLFDGLMTTFGLAELFHASTVVGAPPATCDVTGLPADVERLIPERPALTTLEQVCEHIVFHLLRDHSTSLYHHLANTNMFEQLLVFLPRWVRNLFTRELTTPQLVVVWDGIFAVFYYDDVDRATRRRTMSEDNPPVRQSLSERLFRGASSSSASTAAPQGEEFPTAARSAMRQSVNPETVVYAGSPQARDTTSVSSSTNFSGTAPTVPVSSNRLFSRTVLGMAVAILLHLEEDLMELHDDFALLRRLTASPILSPMVDPVWLLNTAMAIANTRPRGIILVHRRRTSDGATSERALMSRSAAAAAATRLTKEELMLQQRSVALVVERITDRLADVLHVELSDSPSTVASSLRLGAEELSVIRGALRELQCVADRLSFL